MASSPSRRILIWTPRVLSALIVFTFALLGTDAFHQSGNKIIQFGRFLTHLLPCFLAIGTSFLAWYWPLIGGSAFLVLALSYLLTAGIGAGLQAHLIITAPLALCGVLFLVSGLGKKKKKKKG